MPRSVEFPSRFAAAFEKAEDQVSRFFRNRRDDPSRSTIEISNERFVLVRGASLSIEFFEIMQRLFPHSEHAANGVASQVLFDIAHALGKADAVRIHKLMGLCDPISKLAAGPVFFSYTGWAFVRILEESSVETNEDYYLLYDHPFSFEADAWIRAGKHSDFPVCLMNAGYSSGWCEESFGLPLVATEISCRARGDAECRFIMAPPARIEARVADYFRKNPEQNKKPGRELWKSFDREWAKEAQLETALRDRDANYRRLFDVSPDAIFVWDRNSIIQTVNKSAVTLLGYEMDEELIGRNWQDLVSPEERQVLAEDIQRLEKSGGISGAEFRIQRKDGSSCFVQGRVCQVLDSAGKPTQAIAIARDITELKAAETALFAQARLDTLTGLPNRSAFVERLHDAFASSRRGAPAFAVLYLDLDGFKDVNDTLGHEEGDRLLQAVAARLEHGMRESDVVARFGGDEFAILQTDLNEPADAGVLAAALTKSLAAPYEIDGNEIHVTVSIGVSFYDPGIADSEAMLMQSDLALYRAKEEGRDRYCFHTAELDREVRERVGVTKELRAALENHELELYYQPLVEFASSRIVGLEALIRWNHPQRGLVMPDAFIPLAEKSGSIRAIGRWALDEAGRQFKTWRDQGIAPPLLSINVSALELRGGEFERFLTETLKRWSIAPGDIELELTETVLMEVTQRHKDALARLKELGVSIAVDDFGTGYSSLAYLSGYPVNRLKIAQLFTLGSPDNARDVAIIKATLNMARELGIEVVAEGVQNKGQRDFLVSAGCTVGQGFYFSTAVQAECVSELLRRGLDGGAIAARGER